MSERATCPRCAGLGRVVQVERDGLVAAEPAYPHYPEYQAMTCAACGGVGTVPTLLGRPVVVSPDVPAGGDIVCGVLTREQAAKVMESVAAARNAGRPHVEGE